MVSLKWKTPSVFLHNTNVAFQAGNIPKTLHFYGTLLARLVEHDIDNLNFGPLAKPLVVHLMRSITILACNRNWSLFLVMFPININKCCTLKLGIYNYCLWRTGHNFRSVAPYLDNLTLILFQHFKLPDNYLLHSRVTEDVQECRSSHLTLLRVGLAREWRNLDLWWGADTWWDRISSSHMKHHTGSWGKYLQMSLLVCQVYPPMYSFWLGGAWCLHSKVRETHGFYMS